MNGGLLILVDSSPIIHTYSDQAQKFTILLKA